VIVASGFNPENKNEDYITYKFQGHHKITVWLKLDMLYIPDAGEGFTQQYNTVKYGKGIFEYEFPSKRSFKWPNSKEFYESRMKVYNGQLILFLDQETMD